MAEEEDPMTEEDWLSADSAQELLDSALLDNASGRKLRLVACACCRRIWGLLNDDRLRRAVELAERYADGDVSEEQLEQACETALQAHSERDNDAAYYARMAAVFCADRSANCAAVEGAERSLDATLCDLNHVGKENEIQAKVVRDIFGNPFHPVTIAHPPPGTA